MTRYVWITLAWIVALGLAACSSEAPESAAMLPTPAPESKPGSSPAPVDIFSFANTDQFITRHLKLDLAVDFDARVLGGTATLLMKRLGDAADPILLDTRDLDVSAVSLKLPGLAPRSVTFRLLPAKPRLGQALEVDLPEESGVPDEFELEITYRTRPESTALQWLPPELTAGGEHPFLFSQSQSIHARSWVPLQDTPSVRFTYEAIIRTPPGLLALMSADNDPETPLDGEYHFEMPQPIPSYLLAIAVGDLRFAKTGERTGVYSEPAVLQASAWEFADTQAMLEVAEANYGPYEWGRYDLLILPPSFPFGGMENPRLSFITPSVLAGDRSLVALIAHELAHSWSGNLVTNATWRDIWLNEGITSYLDARLIEILYGTERANEERYLSYQEMLREMQTVSPAMQALAPDLSSGDPDESQGSVHYSKGQLFLQHLEAVFGRQRFDAFLTAYFGHFKWQSITTEQFLDYLDEHLLRAESGKFTRAQAEEWVYQPGVPADATLPQSRNLELAVAAALAWDKGEITTAELPVDDWSPHAVVQFLNNLPSSLEDAQLAELDARLGLSQSNNAEITRVWFTQVAQRRYLPAYPRMREYLERFGRIRLINPVYTALAGNGSDANLAREIFASARSGYHPLTVVSIERALSAAPAAD